MRVPDFLETYPEIDEESLHAGIARYLANRSVFDAELEARNAEGERQLAEWLAARNRSAS